MANLKTTENKTKSQSMGMHSEVLTGRTQQKFFNPDEAENFYYFGTYDVDFNKRTELDVKEMTATDANKEIDNLMLFAGRPGARGWRRMLSDDGNKPGAGPELVLAALAQMAQTAQEVEAAQAG